jgi:hypothetical protein
MPRHSLDWGRTASLSWGAVVDPIGRTGANACYPSALPDGDVDDDQIAFLIAVLGKAVLE